jgi:hypothetical protein
LKKTHSRKNTQRDVAGWRSVFKNVFHILLGAFLFLSIAGFVYFWNHWLLQQPVFQVHHMHVVGNRRISTPELLAMAGLSSGMPMASLDMDMAAVSLRKHPWIERVSVRRRWPDTVFVDVREHQAALLVSLGGVYVANKEGVLFKRFTASDRLHVPLVTGLARDALTEDKMGLSKILQSAVRLAEAWREQGVVLASLEELHWDKDLGWSVITRVKQHEGKAGWPVRVHMGFEAPSRVVWAAKALVALATQGKIPEVVWVEGSGAQGRVQVRLRKTV